MPLPDERLLGNMKWNIEFETDANGLSHIALLGNESPNGAGQWMPLYRPTIHVKDGDREVLLAAEKVLLALFDVRDTPARSVQELFNGSQESSDATP